MQDHTRRLRRAIERHAREHPLGEDYVMPWILTGEHETFTAATINAEENTYEDTTLFGHTDTIRTPVLHLNAVIIHHPNGDKTPVQTYTLHGAGAYEITWTSQAQPHPGR